MTYGGKTHLLSWALSSLSLSKKTNTNYSKFHFFRVTTQNSIVFSSSLPFLFLFLVTHLFFSNRSDSNDSKSLATSFDSLFWSILFDSKRRTHPLVASTSSTQRDELFHLQLPPFRLKETKCSITPKASLEEWEAVPPVLKHHSKSERLFQ